MPAVDARDSSAPAGPKTGLIIAIVICALLLIIVVVVALLIPMLKRWREARKRPPPSTLEEFMSKAERERVLDKAYGHRNSDSTGSMGSMGPLLADAPAARQPRIPRAELPLLQANPRSDDEDYELYPRIQTGPASHTRASPPPDLRLAIPPSAPIPASKWAYHQPPSPSSPASAASSESMYSERSASTRMHTVDLASPAPPVPTLPAYLRPRSELPPETPPLERGNTRAVAELLKSRAKRVSDAPQRSMTRTSRIERADSIREAPSPSPSPSPSSFSPSSFYGTTDSAAFTDTLEYYSHPTDPGDDDAMSVSSYDTVRPTKSAR